VLRRGRRAFWLPEKCYDNRNQTEKLNKYGSYGDQKQRILESSIECVHRLHLKSKRKTLVAACPESPDPVLGPLRNMHNKFPYTLVTTRSRNDAAIKTKAIVGIRLRPRSGVAPWSHSKLTPYVRCPRYRARYG